MYFFVMLCFILQLEPSMMIIYGRGQSTTNTQYLNTERPLWILEDQVRKHDDSTTQASLEMPSRPPIPMVAPPVPPSLTFLVRTSSVKSPTTPPLMRPQTSLRLSKGPLKAMPMPRRIRLPSHYVNTKKEMEEQVNGTAMHWRRRHSPQRLAAPIRVQLSPASMPIFDSAPGQDIEQQTHPVFFYNGPRGELIVNTMLSTQRYPMLEPVPGQVLYPPLTPMFRPKPIVERVRLPSRSEFMNLTLIPFYEHEAISTPFFNELNRWSKPMAPTTTTKTTTTPIPKVYETQLKKSSNKYKQDPNQSHRQQYKRQRKHKKAKAKQYTAYHSPDEVQWQPPVVEVLQFKRGDAYRPTTNKSTTPKMTTSSINNHRHFSPAAMATTSALLSSSPEQLVGFDNNVGVPYDSINEASLDFTDTLTNNPYDNHNSDDDDVEDIEDTDADATRQADDEHRLNPPVEFEQNFPIIYFEESNEQELAPLGKESTSTEESSSSTAEEHRLTSTSLDTTPENSSLFHSLRPSPSLTLAMTSTTPSYRTFHSSTDQIESRHSSRYALTKEYYAFPVYTLGKLLHSTSTTEKIPTSMVRPTLANTTGSNASTWFILNSRYKGPYKDQSYPFNNKKGFQKYYTSKYIANSSASPPSPSYGRDSAKQKPKNKINTKT